MFPFHKCKGSVASWCVRAAIRQAEKIGSPGSGTPRRCSRCGMTQITDPAHAASAYHTTRRLTGCGLERRWRCSSNKGFSGASDASGSTHVQCSSRKQRRPAVITPRITGDFITNTTLPNANVVRPPSHTTTVALNAAIRTKSKMVTRRRAIQRQRRGSTPYRTLLRSSSTKLNTDTARSRPEMVSSVYDGKSRTRGSQDIQDDPNFASLRSDPEFQDLIRTFRCLRIRPLSSPRQLGRRRSCREPDVEKPVAVAPPGSAVPPERGVQFHQISRTDSDESRPAIAANVDEHAVPHRHAWAVVRLADRQAAVFGRSGPFDFAKRERPSRVLHQYAVVFVELAV